MSARFWLAFPTGAALFAAECFLIGCATAAKYKGDPAAAHYQACVDRVVCMREGQSCSGDFIWQSLEGMRRDSFGADEAEIVLKADGSEPSEGAA